MILQQDLTPWPFSMSRLQERQLQWVGYIVVMASNIERALDQILVEMIKTKFEIGAIIVTDMGTQEKIDLALDLVHLKFRPGHWFLERAVTFLKLYQEAIKLRNDLAHGAVALDIPTHRSPILRKYRARRRKGNLTQFDIEMTEEKLSEYGEHIGYAYLCVGYLSICLEYMTKFRKQPAPRNEAGELYGSERAYLEDMVGFSVVSVAEAQRRISDLHRRTSQPEKNPPRPSKSGRPTSHRRSSKSDRL